MSGKRRRGAGAADETDATTTSALPALLAVGADGAGAATSASPSLAPSATPASTSGGLDHNGLEALGLAQEQARRRESTGSLSSKYWLSLSPQAPRHPFVHAWFPIKVFLVDSKKSLKSGWPMRLLVELLYENGEMVPNQTDCVEVQGCNDNQLPALGPNGSVDLKVRVKTVSMAHENKAFFLRFSAAPHDKGMIPSHISILPATSTIMSVIRHRLVITEQPPPTWYKDEGGRDKCIQVQAQLVDEHEQPVQGREVPLRVVLCYEGEECVEVKNQSILKSPLESSPRVDRYGKVSVRVRIEEVSKNHCRQAFVLKLVPDVQVSPEYGDISPDVSSPITVLSKRNKRRPKHGASEDSPELGPQQVGSSAATAGSNLYNPAASVFSLTPSVATMPLGLAYQKQQVAQAAAAAAAAAAATGPVSLSGLSSSLSTVAHASSSVLPSITPTGGPAAPAPSSLSQTSLNGHMMARLASADAEARGLGLGTQPGAPSLSDTIGHLLNWCQHVHDLHSKIEWQHVGFEVQEDGQMNLHRPLYRCPACWSYQDTIRQTGHRDSCKLNKLSSAYRTHVHIYLQDLLNVATGSTGAASASLPYTSPSGNNPGALATANSLMAAYSKNVHSQAGAVGGGGSAGGSYMLNHSLSQASNPNAAHVRNQFPLPSMNSVINSSPIGGGVGGLMHLSSTSGMPRTLSPPARLPSTVVKLDSLGMSGSGSGSRVGDPSINGGGSGRSAADRMLTDSIRTRGNSLPGGAGSDDEPASKKLKTSAAPSSAALFPPSNNADWQNLGAVPLDTSKPTLQFDRGISALDPATLMAMQSQAQSQGAGAGGRGVDSGGMMRSPPSVPPAFYRGSGGESGAGGLVGGGGAGQGSPHAPDPNGLVGSTPFAHLTAYQDPNRPHSTSPGPGAFAIADSDSLPERGLGLLRAGSSINLATLESYMQGQADEGVVDAIHVTTTPFGFPAFGAATPASSSSSSSSSPSPSVTYPLCGFYQYDESSNYLSFVPLSRFSPDGGQPGSMQPDAVPGPIRPDQVAQMERIYAQLRADGHHQSHNSRILTRAQTITLDKLREEALLMHYAAQAGGFLSSEPMDQDAMRGQSSMF